MRFRVVTVFTFITFLLSACAGAPAVQTPTLTANETSSAALVTIRWSVWGSVEELASHQAVTDAFFERSGALERSNIGAVSA